MFATTTQASDTPNKSIVEPQDDSPAQTTTPEGATSDPVPTPESDTSNQPLTPESDTHDQPASSQETLPSNAKLPSSQMPQPVKSEGKATTTSQKKVNPDTLTVSAEKDKSMSSTTRILRGANPEEGTVGLVYNEGCTEVTGYKGKETDIVIPEGVTSIKEGAFGGSEGRTVLTSVKFPSSLTSIGDSAFLYHRLSNIMLPSSLTSIGRAAFYYNELTSIKFSSSLTSIGVHAFSGNQLTSVTLPDSLTSIGSHAFYENKLMSVTVPDSVTDIGEALAKEQSVMISRVRRASYTASELGILTHYKTDRPAKLTSQTKGVTVDGDSVKLDPSFTGSEFIVEWSAWDGRHSGALTIKLVDAVEGEITYLDDAGKTLLADKDVSSMVTGTFDWMTPEPISDYTVDLERSQMLTLSDTGLQTTSLKDKLALTQKTTPEELIDYLKQQPIAPGTQSVELRYVYTKNPAKKGQVTV